MGEIPWDFFNSASLFLSSEEYRKEIVSNYIRKRIKKAEKKGRIKKSKADYLYNHLDKEEISPYMLDFFVHAAFFNVTGWVPTYVLCDFYNTKAINHGDLALWLILLGPIQRTGWTIGRIIYEGIKEKGIKSAFKKRAVALFAGIWPYAGATAYLCQTIHSEYKTDKDLGDFLLDDSLYGIEKKIPMLKRVRNKILNKIYKG